MTAQDIRIGIIGPGNMGTVHATSIRAGTIPGLRLVAVCDIDPTRLEAYPDLPGYADLDQMRGGTELDAVLICTPHYDHVPLGIAALEAGLHVLVEKPIAVHKADAERLITADRKPGQVFAAMFNQRTDPRYQWVRRRIDDGTLGRINRVNWIITDWFRTDHYYRTGGWRATWAGEGGGVLLNQCPHQLDLWQWMFGMPRRAHAFCQIGRFHDIEVEDDVTAYLEYDDGMHGVFITTTGEAPGTNRLEITAENGRVVIEGKTITFDRNDVPSSVFCATTDKAFATPETHRETHTVDDFGEQHNGILKNFAAAIRGTAPLVAPAPEGIHSVELGNAMLHSGLTGQPVDLPLDGTAYEAALSKLIRTSTFTRSAGSSSVASAADMSDSF